MLIGTRYNGQAGLSLIEVLVAIIIVAFGLLGLAGLQSRIQVADVESYQRAQALLLLSEMVDRISANRSQASNYVSATPFGTGDNQPAACAGLTGSALDLCEWSNALKGASEQKASANVGAMVGARGCITQLQAPNPAAGVCIPGTYLVAVAWQGMLPTVTPALTCGQNLYGTDSYRRVISSTITVSLPSCS